MAYKITSMKDIFVDLGKDSYNIIIDKGILNQVGTLISKVISPSKAIIVTDKTVAPLYGNIVLDSLSECKFDVKVVSMELGEEQKSMAKAEELYENLFDHEMDRKSLIVALGGGVLGDLVGFVASTFMRGIPFVQIPTTLLAQVDSSIGGKVAVNHPRGKNMIGCFYQPKSVFIDTDTLRTLPKEEMTAGMVEVIKYGMIKDSAFFEYIEKHLPAIMKLEPAVLEEIIYNSCKVKAHVVELDEKEEGLRAILNYGHTIGHALEALTSYKKYRHGDAVAMGMIYATKIAIEMKLVDEEVLKRQESLFVKLGLSLKDTELNPNDIVSILYQDKKTIGGRLRFVLPIRIGDVVINDGADEETILKVLAD
ncbi:MAG: 3-dehydroquinate synthase [Candidatus Scalindua arabica]|uniref:3-dehydroquinate synthase n=1 Tax=Candidatus Scalindua arabica TaxID=1127984 RepID=A0A941W2C8_9BACT|nr:3-dehydroquinate synthase [Candidatus Scalindua arabica]